MSHHPQRAPFYSVKKVMTLHPTQNHSVTTVTSAETETSPESALVWAFHDKLGSWEAIADVLGFSGMFWWKVAHGKIKKPLSGKVRRCLASSDPKFLRLIQQGAIPYLRRRENKF